MSPADVKPPIIVNANAYASDALMGKIMGDFFVSDSHGKGKAVIEHVPAYPILDGFTNGFNAEVKALCPGCKTTMSTSRSPTWSPARRRAMVSALRSNPGANYLVFDDRPLRRRRRRRALGRRPEAEDHR